MVDWTESFGADDGWIGEWVGDGAWVSDGWTVCELQRWCVNIGGDGKEDDESTEVRVWWEGWEKGESLVYLRKGRSETAEGKRNRKNIKKEIIF